MEITMNSERSPNDADIQSFVVRFWQEAPGRWRGTVRHVQSQTQRGVNSVSAASAFMSERCRTSGPARRPAFDLGWLGGRRLRLTGVAAALLTISLAALFLARDPGSGALVGAAVGAAPTGLLSFVAGALAGGLAVALWMKRTKL
jgi:hypothetical protein